MSDLRIGILGAGAIGRSHARTLTEKIGGATVTAVYDIFEEGAKAIAEFTGAKVYTNADDLINSDEVDAIMITAADVVHAEFSLKGIAANKHVFCEKPLATNKEECQSILDAEMKAGKKYVQVGFMRRFDKDYRKIKEVIDSGKIGEPLMLHCKHRNADTGGVKWSTEMSIKNSLIHEIDVLRWILSEDYVSAQVILPKSSKHAEGYQDPQILLLETASGVRIDIESFVNAKYGYDVQCEVVGEEGTVSLPDPSNVLVRHSGQFGYEVFYDWSLRFPDAYITEFREWVESTKKGIVSGPTAWDGYCASVTADACNEARIKGEIVKISLGEKPELYK